MTVETDQTAGQLDEATMLRVLEIVHEYVQDQEFLKARDEAEGLDRLAAHASSRSAAGTQIGERLVAMYRASLGLEEA